MIILYPLENWNGFLNVDTYKSFVLENIPASQINTTSLTDAEIEIYIKQATRLIKNKITLPTTLEDNLIEATAYLTNYSASKDMLNNDGNNNLKRKSIDGVIEKEWFAPSNKSNDFPDIVDMLLKDYNIVSDGVFAFQRG